MRNSRDIILLLGGHRALANAIGEDWKTVHKWTLTDKRIPSRCWLRIAALSAAKKANVTVEVLAAAKPNPPPAQKKASGAISRRAAA
jgi:hypothetical protein